MQGSSAAAIRQVFTMRIRQALTCPKCGVSSPEMPATYEANVFYAHVSALREARQKAPTCSFDVALRVRYSGMGREGNGTDCRQENGLSCLCFVVNDSLFYKG